MKLPDGFVLDNPLPPAADDNGLPPGFVLDKPSEGYWATQRQMATSGMNDMSRGAGQMADAFRFAVSGAGRDLREDNPNNRVAGAFDALEGRKSPLTEAEYEAARSQSVRDLSSGMLDTLGGASEYLFSPYFAGVRTYASKPLEEKTGIPKELTEFAAGFVPIPGRIPSIGKVKAKTPTIDELEAAYKAVRNSPEVKGATVSMEDVKRFAIQREQELLASGARPTTASAPGTFAELNRMTPKPPPGPTPQQRLQAEMNWETLPEAPRPLDASVDDLLAVKRAFGETAGQRVDFRPTPDARAAVSVLRPLDEMIETAAPGMKEANANYAAAQTARGLDRRIQKAEGRAAANNSGMSMGAKLRQSAASTLENPSAIRGLMPDEIRALEQVRDGTYTRNALRYASNLLGGGGGLGQVVTAGIANNSPLGAWGYLTMPLGYAFRLAENKLTMSAAKKVSEAVRKRSPLGQALESSAQKWAEAREAVLAQPNPTPAQITKLLLTSRNLSTNLKDAGIAISPNDLMKSLQGPMSGRTEDEQP